MAVLSCLGLLTISVFWFYSTIVSAGTPNVVVFFIDDVSYNSCLQLQVVRTFMLECLTNSYVC